jgi:flagellar FliL protein
MTGNPGLDKIIMGLNGLVVAAAAAVVFYSHNMIKPPKTDEVKEFTGMLRNSMVELKKQPVTFNEMVMNLYSRERRLRFLNLTMNLEVYEDGQQERVNTMKPIIIDALIDITGNMRPDELNSVTGKILLEARLKNKINAVVNSRLVKKIYFSKFIIQ